jgi:hypothetical protein
MPQVPAAPAVPPTIARCRIIELCLARGRRDECGKRCRLRIVLHALLSARGRTGLTGPHAQDFKSLRRSRIDEDQRDRLVGERQTASANDIFSCSSQSPKMRLEPKSTVPDLPAVLGKAPDTAIPALNATCELAGVDSIFQNVEREFT